MGYSLNQRGLFAGVVRSLEDRTIKTNAGELSNIFFLILGFSFRSLLQHLPFPLRESLREVPSRDCPADLWCHLWLHCLKGW